MLSGPAILRVSVLLIIAGILAAVVQALLPSPAPGPAIPPASAPETPAAPQPSATVRRVEPPPAAPAAPPAPAAPSAPPAAAVEPAPAPPGGAPAPTQMPSDATAFPAEPLPREAQPDPSAQEAAGQAEVDRAEDSAGPRALAILDLNTASVADLNHLRGGGAIGRAIVAKRPYTSVEQLLSKRVLSRSVYEKIKDQVTVR
ncbi:MULTISPECIES: helix-hairpin-helix domain-containing protein [unclassified Methylobacterium]|uniref:helix-hairpin-helix domain-containing protein n=3 Tax=Methylobacterium TaxID=407 RepID=UPI00047B127D|nr:MULTISPECIES: helix-hairpin-helix domain-containing protein [unclassified Methylobacterium]MBN4095371.1 helix-hairpin-helix domain-containing protein [Methylobacterium sp. OT2]